MLGYVFLLPLLESKFKIVDTCGVHNLHGMPGLLGGFSAFLVVPDVAVAQFNGIVITMFLAIVGGLIAGAIIKATGTTREPYEDSVEFTHLAGPDTENLEQQLQSRLALLETSVSAKTSQTQTSELSEAKALVQGLESRIKILENKIALVALQDGNKPTS